MTNIDGHQGSLLERAKGAFVGAAVGDALGWPCEGRATFTPTEGSRQQLRYVAWEKKSGGRFNPHLEYIGKGEFSDDTQLILAVARSITLNPEWWRHFATAELPVWTIYERGGGGATKRAATAWAAGAAPWKTRKQEDLDRYFDAGGNGVAMRVLPHCVRHARSPLFKDVASDIVTDGVTTHGHPRALVGALAYGFACWHALRRSGTLSYGELLQATIDNVEQWAELPDITSRWPDWASTMSKASFSYEARWEVVSSEMLELLQIANREVNAGAVATVRAALEKLGAYDRKSKGAGTVSAAAAVYIASRFAASPVEGLSRAAFAIGTDTDTIASMTGAILGSVGGLDWLSQFRRETQDINYIERLATEVAIGPLPTAASSIQHVRKTSLARVLKLLDESPKDLSTLPNGMEVETAETYLGPGSTASSNGPSFWKLATKDGLTLFVRGTSRPAKKNLANRDRAELEANKDSVVEAGFSVTAIGISLTVSDIQRSRHFYEEILGLKVTGQTSTAVRIEHVIALREGRESLFAPDSVRLFLNVSDVAECQRKLKAKGVRVRDVTQREKAKSFECADPDGYLLEIFERPQLN